MGRRLTKEEFIKKARDIFGDKYDYSKVIYINNSSKIEIYDKEYGEYFWITPASHLNGCESAKRKTIKLREKFSMGLENFITKSKEIHGDKYDYSKVEYVNNRSKVCIICPEHGEFLQIPDKHLQGEGCPKCCKKNRRYTTEEFIQRAKEIHGDKYDYSKTKYGYNKKDKITITCPIHGDFFITPDSHINGSGCKYCTKGDIFDTNDFIKKALIIHGDKYDYSKVEYNGAHNKIKIICPKHGEFLQAPNKHIQGQGCPECGKLYRIQESKLYNVLKEKLVDVDIIHSYYNKEILGKQELDIYIPQYKIAIEYQGKQHFKPVDFGGYGEDIAEILFSKNCKRDKRKKEICNKHHIKLFYFSDTDDNEFLGEKVYHNYNEFIEIINQVIKKEDEK